MLVMIEPILQQAHHVDLKSYYARLPFTNCFRSIFLRIGIVVGQSQQRIANAELSTEPLFGFHKRVTIISI